MAETKTTIPVEIKMGNAGTNNANLPAFKEGSIIFTKDTKKIYIDPIGETKRIAVGGTDVDLSSKQDKFADLDYVWNSSGSSVNQLSLVLKSASNTTSTGGMVSLIPKLALTNETGEDIRLTGIAAPIADNDAVNKSYVDTEITNKQDKITTDTDLVVKTLTLQNSVEIKYSNVASTEGVQFSNITGDSMVLRKVANGINNDEAVNVSQLNKKQDKIITSTSLTLASLNALGAIQVGNSNATQCVITDKNIGFFNHKTSATPYLYMTVTEKSTDNPSSLHFADVTTGKGIRLTGIYSPSSENDAVNKKYVDDIKTELLNAINHPYTYDETTKELTLIL